MPPYPISLTSRGSLFGSEWAGDRPLVLGHRGASASAPPNTLAAFRLAREVGADGVELDVHLTADGVPVVMHNDTVDATTDGHGPIRDFTLSQLKALDAGSHFGPAFEGERVPTLAEVLEAVGEDLLINIELKPQVGGGPALEEAVATVVRATGMTERVWFSSFKPYALFAMRRLLPEVPCGLLLSPLSFMSLWLMPFTPIEAVHPHHSLVPMGIGHWLRRLGLRSVVWTVNDESTVTRMATAGVDAIITDDPGAVLRQLGRAV